MPKKLIYFLSGFLLLGIGFFAYHFYAANNAEKSLDEMIQETVSESKSDLTISYSSIEVTPFAGDIHFSNVNITQDQEIQRAGSARFDLEYSDFLNFMIWGTKSGLKEVKQGMLKLNDISYTNNASFLEVKIDSLHVDYSGNLWNLIVLGVTRRPAQIQHNIRASGSRFRFQHPEAGIGGIESDSLGLDIYFGKSSGLSDTLLNTVALSGITWTPSASVQEKYQFFIQGFGYQTDAIPFERASLAYGYPTEDDLFTIKEMTINSELFTTSAEGLLVLDQDQFGRSSLRNTTLRIYEMSPQVQNFLQQIEKMMGMQIPGGGRELQIQVHGMLAKPEFDIQP